MWICSVSSKVLYKDYLPNYTNLCPESVEGEVTSL